MKSYMIPRTINSSETFNALVDWFHDEMIVKGRAPGFLIGLSGTDSTVTFCAASKAFEKAGKPNRVLGVHFAPSEDFLDDYPEAETHLWFRDEVLPWLRKQCPQAQIVVDTSIDWRCDGLRWGALMDMSIVSNDKRRMIREPLDQYWVVGTRNFTEEVLFNYSNASTAVSLQPLIHLWKSEVLQISEYLGIPKIAISKSCEADCICGRMRLPAQHIREVDMLLMAKLDKLSNEYVENKIPIELRKQLSKFIDLQIISNNFKSLIPYCPKPTIVRVVNYNDSLVIPFEDGSLNLSEFDHRKHIYIAWFYLKSLPFEIALERYVYHLRNILESAGRLNKFNLKITQAYFNHIDSKMKLYPLDNFNELVEKIPSL